MSHLDFGRMSEIAGALSTAEKAVRSAAFDAILERAPASVDLLSQRTGLEPSAIADAISHLAALGLLVCDGTGSVVGSWGLTLAPTGHRLHISGHDFYTWCAADAVGIPAALGIDAAASSSCFQCGREVAIEIEKGEIARVSPQDVRLWLAEPEVGRSIVGCT